VLASKTHGQLLLKRLGANPFEVGSAPAEPAAKSKPRAICSRENCATGRYGRSRQRSQRCATTACPPPASCDSAL
jgi:hypothetical protein